MAYLVRSLGFEPETSLTTGTFNLVVKDRTRLPPERRAIQSGGNAPESTSTVLETFKKLSFPPLCCQPADPTGFPPVFHNAGSYNTMVELLSSARRNATPAPHGCPVSARAEAEELFSVKDHLEVFAIYAQPFEDHCPRMQTPWPGSFLSGCFCLDARTEAKDSTSRPQTNQPLPSTQVVIPNRLGLRKGSTEKVT